MKGTNVVITLFCFALLAGCARSTSDPALKLSWAAEEFGWKDDPITAEKLLQESLQTYRKQMNGVGLAETYRQYGLFLRSHAVTKLKGHYQEEGFLDETIRYNTRYEKALEYFDKSRQLFAEQKNAGMLSNVYLSMAKTYALMDKVPESCDCLDKGRKSYAPLKIVQVKAREVGVDEAENFEAYITLMQKQMGCPLEMTAGVTLDSRRQ